MKELQELNPGEGICIDNKFYIYRHPGEGVYRELINKYAIESLPGNYTIRRKMLGKHGKVTAWGYVNDVDNYLYDSIQECYDHIYNYLAANNLLA